MLSKHIIKICFYLNHNVLNDVAEIKHNLICVRGEKIWRFMVECLTKHRSSLVYNKSLSDVLYQNFHVQCRLIM